MAVKTLADINTQLSNIGSAEKVSHTLIKDIVDSLDALISLQQAAAQADSVAADVATLVTDFNALLAKLRTAGILAE